MHRHSIIKADQKLANASPLLRVDTAQNDNRAIIMDTLRIEYLRRKPITYTREDSAPNFQIVQIKGKRGVDEATRRRRISEKTV